MSDKVTLIWIAAQVVITRVEGMKAENAQRQSAGASMAYNDEEFFKCANQLEQLLVGLKESA